MRIDDQRIGVLDAVEQVGETPGGSRPSRRRPHRRAARRRARSVTSAIAGTGSIDVVEVVPTVATTAIGRMPARDVVVDAARERIRPHPKGGVAGDAHDVLLPDAERDRGLLDVRMRVFGDVDAQRAEDRDRSCRARECSRSSASRAAASAVKPAIDAVS